MSETKRAIVKLDSPTDSFYNAVIVEIADDFARDRLRVLNCGTYGNTGGSHGMTRGRDMSYVIWRVPVTANIGDRIERDLF